MRFQSSRRDFIVQSSLVAALSTGFMRSSWAQTSANTPPGSPRRGTPLGSPLRGMVEAETAYGRVRGAETRGIKSFKGIPYAASTAGKNRFMPPMKPAAWTGVRDALDYGARAPQQQPRPRGEADEQGATPGQDRKST